MKWSFPFLRLAKDPGLRSPGPLAEREGASPLPQGARIRRGRMREPALFRPLADGRVASTTTFVEIIVLAGLLPSALLWFAQAQSWPLLFPVLVLAPLLLGVSYGFLAGAGSALLTVAVVAGIGLLKPELLKELSKAQAIGLVLVGMCAGEARDIWAARIRRMDALCRYHQARLQQFTSAYHLLQVSHAQLERRMAGSGNSLRSALERLELRQPACNGARDEPLGGIAEWLLEIMVEAGGLHTAAVYEISAKGVLRLPCLAMAGQAADLSPFHPLLRETLRTASLTSVHASHEALHEPVIAIVPLVDAGGHIHGIVSIHDMPFLSVHQDTFELLAVLGRHIGDILMRRARPVGESPAQFALRESLERNLTDAKKSGLPAALIACKVVDADCRQRLVSHCCNSSRGLDQSWTSVNRQGESVIVKLLALTDEAGVSSYLARLESEQTADCMAKGIVTHRWMLDQQRSADELLAELCAACDMDVFDAVQAKPSPAPVGAVA